MPCQASRQKAARLRRRKVGRLRAHLPDATTFFSGGVSDYPLSDVCSAVGQKDLYDPGRPGGLSCYAQSQQSCLCPGPKAGRVSIPDATSTENVNFNGCGLLRPFRSGRLHRDDEPVALMPPRRSAVSSVCPLFLFCQPFPDALPRRAGRSTVIRLPTRVRFAVPRPFALAVPAPLRCGLR